MSLLAYRMGLMPFALLSARDAQRIREEHEREVARLRAADELAAKTAVPWDRAKWKPHWAVQASTYSVLDLFPDLESYGTEHASCDVAELPDSPAEVSPCGKWRYIKRVVPRLGRLGCARGNRKGVVIFDGEVTVPILLERRDQSWTLWMSLTPQEIVTLRGGTRAARKHTIIGGLGMGHSLIEASRKRTVKRVTLVEREQGLVDWLLPAIRPHMGAVDLEVIVGDVYEVMDGMQADAACLDVFSTYGNNFVDDVHMTARRRGYDYSGIGKVWCWGSALLA